MDFKKPEQAVGVNSGLTASGRTVCPRHTTVTHIQKASLVLYGFLHCQSGVGELPLAQASYFSGYPHHGLYPFAHIIALPSLLLDSGSLAQCSLWVSVSAPSAAG